MNKKRPQAVRGPNIFIVNHNSYLDAISVLISVPQPYRMLGKHELNNLPFIGFFYKRIVLSVDRDDIYDRAASLKKMSKTLQSGMSIVLFPEGTFNETMQIFKSFHDGAFNLAISTKTAIVPILILDNKKRMNPRSIFSINPGISRIMMLDAVNSVPEDNTSSLKMKAIDVMEKAWNNYY